MSDNKYKKILEKSYQDLATDVVAGIVVTDDQPKAFQFLRILEKAIEAVSQELKEDSQLANFYQDLVLRLGFIALPSLDEKEIITLLKNYFCYQFKLDDYDLKRKIRIKLLSILLIEDRNKLKEDLKRALLENNEEITKNADTKTVKDWVRGYTTKIGIESKDKLARAQYMVGVKELKNISSREYENLKVLFDFFDILNAPSDTPDGLEEEYPMIVNGKLHIFRKGVLEPVHESKAVEEALKNYSSVNELNSTYDETSDDILSAKEPVVPVITKTPVKHTTELEEILDSYSPASLEYKAISQEIMRLKKTEARKNAKR